MFTHRALVTFSNPDNGEIRVKVPAVTGLSELSISYFGRSASNNYWMVPQIGEEIAVSSDDEHMTNLFWVQTASYNPGTSTPTGISRKSDSLISFNNATRTFTIRPTVNSYEVWVKGVKYTITEPKSLQIPDVTGVYYVAFGVGAVLEQSTEFFSLENFAPVSYIYWRSVDQKAEFFADERHGIVMDWQTHEYLRLTRGAAFGQGLDISGYVTNGNGSSVDHLKFSLNYGFFYDEDIRVDIIPSASPTPNTWEQRLQNGAYCPIYYRDANGWKQEIATQLCVKQGLAHPYYNNPTANSLVEMTANRYAVSWVVASNNLNEPVVIIMGQEQHSNISGAQDEIWGQVDLGGLPIYELRPLYKIIFQSLNTAQGAAIREVEDLRFATSTSTGGAAASGDTVPTGSIVAFAGSIAPSGWLVCDGTAVSRTTYGSLFSTINTVYGAGDGSTTFNLPDLRTRIPVGKAASGTFVTLGATGGAETHTLTTTQIPAHTHTQNPHNHTQDSHDHAQQSHSHTVGTGGTHDHAIFVTGTNDTSHTHNGASTTTNVAGTPSSSTGGGSTSSPILDDGSHSHSLSSTPANNLSATATNNETTATNQNTGGGQAHNNLQPYIVLNYIIKT
jgi:microcystin-dependent protein